MARVIVYKFPALTSEELTELLTLLAAAGVECDPGQDIEDLEAFLAAEAEEDGESKDTTEWVLLVILSPECDVDGGLSQVAGKVARAGGRVHRCLAACRRRGTRAGRHRAIRLRYDPLGCRKSAGSDFRRDRILVDAERRGARGARHAPQQMRLEGCGFTAM